MTTIKVLTEQLAASENECARLREENEQLKQKLAAYGERSAVDQTAKEVKGVRVKLNLPEGDDELYGGPADGSDDGTPCLAVTGTACSADKTGPEELVF